MIRSAWLSFAFLVLVANDAPAQPSRLVTVETLDDELVGRLEQINLVRREVRLAQDSFVTLPLHKVLSIRFAEVEPATGPTRVTLAGGQRFVYQSVEFEDGDLRFILPSGGWLTAPLEAIRDWAFDDQASDRFRAPRDEAADLLLVRTRDGASVRSVVGLVLGVDDRGVLFSLDPEQTADPVRAPWERVVGIQLYRQRLDPAPYCLVTAEGNPFVAEGFEVGEDRVAFFGREGVLGEFPTDHLAEIDLARGRTVPASQLQLVASEWTPWGESTRARGGHAIDASLRGGKIELAFPDARSPGGWPAIAKKRRFSSGAALRSRSALTFELPPGATRLKAWVGIDPAAAAVGDARVLVLAGEQQLWSGRISGATAPQALSVDLTDASTLVLRVDYGANLDAGDVVHFADLRVIQ